MGLEVDTLSKLKKKKRNSICVHVFLTKVIFRFVPLENALVRGQLQLFSKLSPLNILQLETPNCVYPRQISLNLEFNHLKLQSYQAFTNGNTKIVLVLHLVIKVSSLHLLIFFG